MVIVSAEFSAVSRAMKVGPGPAGWSRKPLKANQTRMLHYPSNFLVELPGGAGPLNLVFSGSNASLQTLV